ERVRRRRRGGGRLRSASADLRARPRPLHVVLDRRDRRRHPGRGSACPRRRVGRARGRGPDGSRDRDRGKPVAEVAPAAVRAVRAGAPRASVPEVRAADTAPHRVVGRGGPMTATREQVLLDDGSACELAAPADWNGMLVTQPDLWDSELDRCIQTWLLDHGYATVRHSRDVRKWNVTQGLANEDEAVRRHAERFGEPGRGVVVWGGPMGGLITRLLIEHR